MAAYPSLNLEKLAILLVYIKKYEHYCTELSIKKVANGIDVDEIENDPLYLGMLTFLECFCSGIHGKGIAIGGTISPYLMNLYCEVYIDFSSRYICKIYDITYTRFADDLVFSRIKGPVSKRIRRAIRKRVNTAMFEINHRKSKVLNKKREQCL